MVTYSGSRQRGSSRRGASARPRQQHRNALWHLLIIVAAASVATIAACVVALQFIPDPAQPVPEVVEAAGPDPVGIDTEGFDPAHIIDDEVFYNTESMSLEDVEAFIARVNEGCVPGADGAQCLAQARFDTDSEEPSLTCPGGYEAATGESAASIIWKVSQSCGINPQVLLVLIQREQGLLTASGAALTQRDYEAAAGYACPDGGACDASWAGFFRQIYGAASQFQRYRLAPSSYAVVAGTPTAVAFSPDHACGAAELTVANQATAGLYDYTPYQPNEAVYEGGDSCTSWGNWNFYGYFRTFFGDPTP